MVVYSIKSKDEVCFFAYRKENKSIDIKIHIISTGIFLYIVYKLIDFFSFRHHYINLYSWNFPESQNLVFYDIQIMLQKKMLESGFVCDDTRLFSRQIVEKFLGEKDKYNPHKEKKFCRRDLIEYAEQKLTKECLFDQESSSSLIINTLLGYLKDVENSVELFKKWIEINIFEANCMSSDEDNIIFKVIEEEAKNENFWSKENKRNFWKAFDLIIQEFQKSYSVSQAIQQKQEIILSITGSSTYQNYRNKKSAKKEKKPKEFLNPEKSLSVLIDSSLSKSLEEDDKTKVENFLKSYLVDKYKLTIDVTDKEKMKELFFDMKYASDEKIVRALIKLEIDINTVRKYGDSPLHIATQMNNTEVIKLFLKLGADVNVKNILEQTSLHIAVENETLPLIKILLNAKANINLLDSKKYFPLYIALEKQNFPIFQYLLQNGAEINLPNGKSLLLYVVKNNLSKYFDLLLKEGIDIFHLDPIEKISAFEYLKQDIENPQNKAMLKSLIMHKIQEKIPDFNESKKLDGDDYLFYAIELGYDHFIEPLIDLGANIKSEKNKINALQHALNSKASKKCVRILLNETLKNIHNDWTYIDNYSLDKLLMEVIGLNQPELVSALFYLDNKLSTKNYVISPLFRALYFDEIKSIEILIENGFDINAQNKKGKTLLIEAVFWGKLDTLLKIIDLGADQNIKNKDQESFLSLMNKLFNENFQMPLFNYQIKSLFNKVQTMDIEEKNFYFIMHRAISEDNIELFERILKKHTFSEKHYKNPLYYALIKNSTKIVRKILESCPNLINLPCEVSSKKDDYQNKKTPLQVAVSWGYKEMICLLKEIVKKSNNNQILSDSTILSFATTKDDLHLLLLDFVVVPENEDEKVSSL